MEYTDHDLSKMAIVLFKSFPGALDAAVILTLTFMVFALLLVLLAEVCISTEELLQHRQPACSLRVPAVVSFEPRPTHCWRPGKPS